VAQKTKINQSATSIVGREAELKQLSKAIELGRNVLIEGPVGVGKTFLVQQVLHGRKKGFVRVDGDSRYTEQKLTGWFDPPIVLKKGYIASAFVEGPLVKAMREGTVLFINELNRMPEAVQNILLPAMDERLITIPKLGEVKAKDGFLVLATQNPREFTATHMLSEALLDRFEWIRLGYQSRPEELEILQAQTVGKIDKATIARILDIVRATRRHASLKRGASLRAALAVAKLVAGGMDLETSCLMALSSRVELVSSEDDLKEIILGLVHTDELPLEEEKKKDLRL
jgi:gas vesicle protein GvpN